MKYFLIAAFFTMPLLAFPGSLVAGGAEVLKLKAENACPGCNLAGDNLSGLNLAGANLAGANLTNANLSNANLTNANLTNANFSRANLHNTNLSGAKCGGKPCPRDKFSNATTNENTIFPDGSRP